MVKIIQDLWIILKSGVVIFNRVFNSHLDAAITGSLMSAISIYSEHLAEGGLSSFEIAGLRFTILKKDILMFVGSTSKEIKAKKVSKELQTISRRFSELYNDEFLESWNSEINVFRDFKDKIADILEDSAND